MLIPVAYGGAYHWRAAVHGSGDEPCLLMTAHIFNDEHEAMRFAKLFLDANEEQRKLLEEFGKGAGCSEKPLTTIMVELLESYQKDPAKSVDPNKASQ